MTASTPTPSARTPPPKQKVTLRLDRDVIAFFKQGGRGFQTRINQVLRDYVEAQRRR
jgi:uncharacterized protein (DUF4415 family)